jgi:predicted Zn-ribbon and HTH transcriptional regulator
MKWTVEKVETLIKLVDNGYKPDEIAEILGNTPKSVSLKMNRMGLKLKFTKPILCKNCGFVFEGYIKQNRIFCSKSCSVSFNNSNRIHSELTKKKISEKLKSYPKKVKNIIVAPRKCKICNKFNIVKKRKSICDGCKVDYYDYYRSECRFKFSVFEFPSEFDLHLVDTHGWYSPSNKRNNLTGVSKDHMYSVMDGYLNKIPAEIISHPANCKLLYSDNSKKNKNSSISIEELKSKIDRWNIKYSNKKII